MSAPLIHHVGAPDVRARTRSAPVRGPGALLNAAGRAGAPRPRQGQALLGVSSLTYRSPIAGSGLFFLRDRPCRQAGDRARVPASRLSNSARR